jgi:hypothetical protein
MDDGRMTMMGAWHAAQVNLRKNARRLDEGDVNRFLMITQE